MRTNEWGQPIGDSLSHWKEPPSPLGQVICGRYGRLEPLEISRHTPELFEALSLDREGRSWTYLPYGPFSKLADYQSWLQTTAAAGDPFFYVIRELPSQKILGIFALMHIQRDVGSIEVGHVHFSPLLQKTRIATEAIYLLIKSIFDLGYRRCEWKCDSLNEASKKAAERFGFQFEGRFRNARIYKGRTRDTDWYSIIDREWPRLAQAFESWLSPENFDETGRQRGALKLK
jgi:RimJ/RimL family protein N-acetyltransferase